MRLRFEVPDGWSGERRGAVSIVQRGGFGSRVQGILVEANVDPRTLLEGERPAGSRVEYVQVLEALTARAGWRMKLVTLEVVDARGRRIETRIAGIYEMVHLLGIAVATVVGEDDRETILGILNSANAQLWPDDAVCVSELWSMEEP